MIRKYSIKEIEKIFSDSNRYKCWLEIELLALKYLQKKGTIGEKVLEEIKHDLLVIPPKIREIEKITNHDVVAFLSQIEKTTDLDIKKWLHYGLTSSDLLDTANSMMLHQANRVLLRNAYDLLLRLKRMAFLHKDTYCLNRISGSEVAGVLTFGYKVSLCYEDIKEAISDLERHRRYIECVSISGTMGICSHMDPGLQDFIAKELDLYSVDCSNQVLSRDRYYKYFQLLNRLVQAIHNLCLELRLHSRTEIGEISEGFHEKQMGSSSTPHKRNPVNLENICGLCRLFNSYYSVTSKNIPIWFERDVSHSSVDSVVFLDAITTSVQIIRRMYKVLKSLNVNAEKMKKNIGLNGGLIYKDAVYKALLKANEGVDASVLAARLNEVCDFAKNNSVSLKSALKNTDLVDSLEEHEIENLFKPNVYFPALDIFYDRIFMDEYKKHSFDSIFYEKSEILNAIENIAVHLNHRYGDTKKAVRLIASRDESVVFLSHLLVRLNFPVELKTIDISVEKYQSSQGKHITGATFDVAKNEIKGKDVILLDAIWETGITITALKKRVKSLGAKSVSIVVLFVLDSKEKDKNLDVYGLFVPVAKGLAGFGLANKAGEFRNCGFLGRLKDCYF